jgi:hypothetical protein
MRSFALLLFALLIPYSLIAQDCLTGDCTNGIGTYKYKDGSTYKGQFKNGLADGFGVCYYADGTQYVGQFKDHKTAGHGAWHYADSTIIPGYIDETGKFVEASTLKKGCLEGNCENGFGTKYYDSGTKYVGEFKNSKCHGYGTCYFDDGSMYVGYWANHEFNGRGTSYKADGTIEEGIFKDHRYVGKTDGAGCISGDCDNGFGIYRYNEGDVYTGEFKEGFRHGQGTYFWASGDKYVGNWISGKYEGQGTMTYKDGLVESGIWKDTQLVSKSLTSELKPTISWEEPSASNISITYNTFQVKACIKSESEIQKIQLKLNGSVIATETSFAKDALSGCSVIFSKSFSLKPGKNTLVISAQNSTGTGESSERIVDLVAVSQQKRLALVIGNSTYMHANALKNPVNDARSMARILESQGFKVIKVENAATRDLKMAIDKFGQELTNYDVGLFYYAGHGIQVKGLNYLVPIDVDIQSEAQVEYDCVQADRVLSFMELAQTDVNIIILDACRNNPFKRSWSRSAETDGLAFMNAPTGTLIAYSTAPGRTASDGMGENGLYTEALMQEINNPDLTILQVFQRVRNKVADKSSKAQIPWESTSLTGDFFFGRRN